MARCAYSAFCTGPDERTEKILFFRGRINDILLFFMILCRVWRFLSFFRIGKRDHKGSDDAVGGSARALLGGVGTRSWKYCPCGEDWEKQRRSNPDGLIAAIKAVLCGLGRYADRAHGGGRTSAQEMMINEMMG